MKAEKIMVESSKGKLATVIEYPNGETDKLAILLAGYLDSKDYTHLMKLAETLAKEGYTTVRFDPTGTWESEGDISQYNTTQYLTDVKNVIEYMLTKRNFNHILIGGHSRGGQISLLYAARDQRISAVLGIMPSSTLSKKEEKGDQRLIDWKKNGFSMSSRDLPESRNSQKNFKVPISHLDDLRKYNVAEDVRKINVPVILIAGELDTLCPPETVKEIFDNANEPKKFVVIPEIGHDYRLNNKEIDIVNARVLRTLKELGIIKEKSKI